MEEQLAPVLDWLHRWWPALLTAVVAWIGLTRFRLVKRAGQRLDPESLALHQIKMTLGCDGVQARQLLKAYGGDVAQAISEVKMGRAALPGEVLGDVPEFAGEVKELRTGEARSLIVGRDDSSFGFGPEQQGYLVIGLLNCEQRPDKNGFCDATRGRMFAQLFVNDSGAWKRYRLDSGKLNYKVLGERMQNQASRNFQRTLSGLKESNPGIVQEASVDTFVETLKAPVYKQQSDFERAAVEAFKSWKAQ